MGRFDHRTPTPHREARGINSKRCQVVSINSPANEALGEVHGAHLEEVGQSNVTTGELFCIGYTSLHCFGLGPMAFS